MSSVSAVAAMPAGMFARSRAARRFRCLSYGHWRAEAGAFAMDIRMRTGGRSRRTRYFGTLSVRGTCRVLIEVGDPDFNRCCEQLERHRRAAAGLSHKDVSREFCDYVEGTSEDELAERLARRAKQWCRRHRMQMLRARYSNGLADHRAVLILTIDAAPFEVVAGDCRSGSRPPATSTLERRAP